MKKMNKKAISLSDGLVIQLYYLIDDYSNYLHNFTHTDYYDDFMDDEYGSDLNGLEDANNKLLEMAEKLYLETSQFLEYARNDLAKHRVKNVRK